MFVNPNTDIYFLRGVNLNKDYDHTIYFSTLSAQTTFFLSKEKMHINNSTYQRKERGWLKVGIGQNSLWDCTYMMYRNTGFSNKWFYAFILSIEYVSDNVSLINFEIDVMQTWMFDFSFEKCFVDREHSATDELFEHLVEEDFDMGNELSVQVYRRLDLEPDRINVVYTNGVDTTADPPELTPVTPRRIGNYFSGVGIISFDTSVTSGWDALGDFLHEYIDNGFEDAILSIYQCPHFISTLIIDPYNTDTWSFTPNFVNVDGYVPKNKKLFNYPYNFLKLSNNKGDDTILKHELWDNSNNIGEFELKGVGVGIPSVMCYPVNYRDIAKDYENGLMCMGFNECAWVGDAYQVWLAQNRKNLELQRNMGALEIGVGLIGAGTGAVIAGSGGAFGIGMMREGGSLMSSGVRSIVDSVLDKIKQKNKLDATPRVAHGHYNNDIFNMQVGISGYTCYQMTIKREFAKIIDEYFSKFGYACHEVKIPNINARQNWTYTKTVGCELNGNIPSDDLVTLKAIFDKGITFWTNGNNIGNYGDFTNPIYANTLIIVTQPTDKTAATGEQITWNVTAYSPGTISYQWQYKSKTGTTWSNASGTSAQTNSYTLTVASVHYNLDFRCKLTDTLGNTVYTNTVNVYANS